MYSRVLNSSTGAADCTGGGEGGGMWGDKQPELVIVQ